MGTAHRARRAPANWAFAGAMAWLVVAAGFGGYGTYLLVLRHHGAAVVSALLFLTPPTRAARCRRVDQPRVEQGGWTRADRLPRGGPLGASTDQSAHQLSGLPPTIFMAPVGGAT